MPSAGSVAVRSAPQRAGDGSAHRAVTRWRGDVAEARQDALAEEIPIAIRCNGEAFAVMMASPIDLEDFVHGFAVTERLVERISEIVDIDITPQIDGIEVSLVLSAACAARLADRPRAFEGRSGCGICGTRDIDALLNLPPTLQGGAALSALSLRKALAQLPAQQVLNQETGATHAAAWCESDGEILLLREDVGRHNALDKLIGAMLRGGIDAAHGFAVLTSRASMEMVIKAARAGIRVLAAVSAPTVLAVSLADSAGITLIGFARGSDCTVYTHPHRYIAA